MHVAAGDAEREDERDPALQRRPHVRLDVGRLVGRHLVARAQPVGPPVAAGALGDDDVDAPLQGLGDLVLDVGRRGDVVDEAEDADVSVSLTPLQCGVPQDPAQHLARGVARQFVDEADRARPLVAGQPARR